MKNHNQMVGGRYFIQSCILPLHIKPWFHVKIKLFERILVFYFDMEPHLK